MTVRQCKSGTAFPGFIIMMLLLDELVQAGKLTVHLNYSAFSMHVSVLYVR